MKLRNLLILLTLLVTLAGVSRTWRPPTFNADQIAASETRMWKSYYAGRPQDLGSEMLGTLRAQFGLSLPDALLVTRDLAHATIAFQKAGRDSEKHALPALKGAYERIRKVTGGSWDAEAAARAELEWWVKRRTPGHNSPEEVGRSISKLYAILYGQTNPEIRRAGLLRAQAAALRDRQGDWKEVEKLLQKSYRALLRGIN